MIIAGFAGVGKTTCAKMFTDDAIDFVAMPYKYEDIGGTADGEACKASPENTLHPDWPLNYIDAIKSIKDDYKYIFIPADVLVLSLLEEEKLPFLMVRPFRTSKEEYRRRFIERGNTEEFLDVFIGQWDSFMDSIERIGSCVHITLDIDEYLSDVIRKFDTIAASLLCASVEMMVASGAIEIIKDEGEVRIELKAEMFDNHVDE